MSRSQDVRKFLKKYIKKHKYKLYPHDRIKYDSHSSWYLSSITDSHNCVSCGEMYNLTVDHIVPISKGGALLDIHNMQLMCKTCNGKKGNNENYIFMKTNVENVKQSELYIELSNPKKFSQVESLLELIRRWDNLKKMNSDHVNEKINLKNNFNNLVKLIESRTTIKQLKKDLKVFLNNTDKKYIDIDNERVN